jgi:hypothetical protein
MTFPVTVQALVPNGEAERNVDPSGKAGLRVSSVNLAGHNTVLARESNSSTFNHGLIHGETLTESRDDIFGTDRFQD